MSERDQSTSKDRQDTAAVVDRWLRQRDFYSHDFETPIQEFTKHPLVTSIKKHSPDIALGVCIMSACIFVLSDAGTLISAWFGNMESTVIWSKIALFSLLGSGGSLAYYLKFGGLDQN